jgi:outer membrane lipoprotein SlyB
MRIFFAAYLLSIPLASCANKSTTDIGIEDSGQAYKVKFGTVLAQRPVSIRSDSTAATGAGALLGGGIGALVLPTNVGAFAGFVAGGIAGSLSHAAVETENGIEYTVALDDGTTIILMQVQGRRDQIFQSGDPVMVQFGARGNRVLATAHLPEKVAAPKRVQVEGTQDPPEKLKAKSCEKGPLGASTREVCVEF